MQWRPFRLQNHVMHYEWGNRGKNAYIPNLIGLKSWDEALPWAELWIGAHPKAPSRVEIDGSEVELDELIRTFPEEMLGSRVVKSFGPDLPFLLKILSAAEPLSIQAHPNTSQAQELHLRYPQHYPDNRHKPEIAIALSEFECLVGIKPEREIKKVLDIYPEIADLLFYENTSFLTTSSLRFMVFKSLIGKSVKSPGQITSAVTGLQNRLSRKNRSLLNRDEELFLYLTQKYPKDDVGLLLLFLMNRLFLEPGEAVYLSPGIPHAYICGNIVECMANSDNVVRVGLTPKYKDAKTLLKIVDCSSHPHIFPPPTSDSEVTIYKIPATEFQITRYCLNKKQIIEIPGMTSPTVCLIIEGQATITWGISAQENLKRGESIFIPAVLSSFVVELCEGSLMFSVRVP